MTRSPAPFAGARPECAAAVISLFPEEAGAADRLNALAAGPFCWNSYYSFARRHGIDLWIASRLGGWIGERCPAELWGRWTDNCRQTAVYNLSRAAELAAISKQLGAAGIDCLVVKGPVTAQTLYGDIGLRPFGDLDLVIPQAAREAACEILRTRNYRPEFTLAEAAWARFYRRYRELHFTHPVHGWLDLHWELWPSSYSFVGAVEGFRERAVTVAGPLALRTLGPEDTLLFHLLHAAKHSWQSLGWLLDLALQLRQSRPLDRTRIQSSVQLPGCGRLLATGLMLVQQFTGALPPGMLTDLDLPRRASSKLIARASSEIMKLDPLGESGPRWPWRRMFYQAMVRPRDRMRYLYDTLLAPTPFEWQAVPLPAGLNWMYPAIRTGRLAVKHSRRWIAGRRADPP